MNREEAKEYILGHSESLLEQDKSRKGFVCPLCGSGSGRTGTGLTSKDKIHYTCWAGCFTSADIIDIVGKQYGLSEYNEKLQRAAELMGISIDNTPSKPRGTEPQPTRNTPKKDILAEDAEPEEDYTSFFLQANKDIDKTSYHRGLTIETLNRFKVGYVAEWRHPKKPNTAPSPRLIIPTSKNSYLARDTRAELSEEQKKYSKSKAGSVHIFNSRALYEAKKPIFIVEGEIDALSIIDVGGEAVALGSTANKRALLTMLESRKPAQALILSMDNDTAGENANRELVEGLKRLSIPYYEINIAKGYKDANEALNANREAFKVAVEDAENIEAETLEQEREQLKREAVGYHLQSFITDIEKSKTAAFYPTGFSNLDALLDGGLYAGLYVVGAVSSLGKTTFCLQIADQIAQTGKDVIIFSLEMARNELIAKSISRLTLLEDLQRYETTTHAKTTRGVLTGARYANYSQTEKELIQDAITTYSRYAQNIYITEGIGNIGVKDIRAKVEKHIKITGKAPIVIIDYLQILAPADVRATDKQNTDKTITELKRLSRDYSTPIIGISSFNRDNYTAPVNLASFKESGAIEYSSDVLIGLQYDGMDYQEGENEKKREKRIRELKRQAIIDGSEGKAQTVQVKVLKQRNGTKGDTLIKFYPMFNYFLEEEETSERGANYERLEVIASSRK